MPLFKRNDERGNTETNYKRSRQIGLDTNIQIMVGIHVHIAEESSEKEMLILTIFYHGAKGELMIREIYNVCACIVIAQKEIKPTIRKQI